MKSETKQHEDRSFSCSREDILEELWSILVLVVPIAVTNFIEFLPSMFALSLLGRDTGSGHNSTINLDALGMGRMFYNVTTLSIGIGYMSVLSTLCPQALGAGQEKKLALYFQQTLILIYVGCIPCYIVMIFAEPILLAFGQEQAIAERAAEYCILVLPGFLFSIFAFCCQRVLNALERPMIFFFIELIATIASYPIIYLFYEWTDYSVRGAAFAYNVYTFIPFFFVIIWNCCNGYRFLFVPYGWKVLDFQHFKKTFFTLALPSLFQICLEWWIIEIILLIVGTLPNSEIVQAASISFNYTEVLIIMVYIGLNTAASVRVGNFIGANKPQKAKMSARISMVVTFFAAVCVGITLFFVRSYVTLLFTTNEETLKVSQKLFIILACMQIFDSSNQVCAGILKGLGRQNVGAKVQFVSYYIFGVPLGCIITFCFNLQDYGLFILWGSVATAQIFGSFSQMTYLYFIDWNLACRECDERLQNSNSLIMKKIEIANKENDPLLGTISAI